MKHSQHRYTHASPLKIMLTNDFDNVRSGNNGFKLIIKNVTDSTSQTVEVTVPAKRYDAITDFHTALATALTSPVSSAVAALEVGATSIVAVINDSDNLSKLTITITGNTDVFSMDFAKSSTCFNSVLANDAERIFGLVDSKDNFPALNNFTSSLIQKGFTHVDVNHIKFVQFYTSMGKQKHGGVIAVVPIKRAILHSFEEVDLYGSHSLHHAFSLDQHSATDVHVQCADMHGNAIVGKGHVNLMFKLFRKAAVDSYSKRIRIH